MHAEIHGPSEATALVCLHGGIGTGRYHWSKSLDALSARYRVHLPDLPGHGRTPLDGDRYDREVLVDSVESYLEQLEQPVHVAAFSMGGHASMALATRRPELFASLVLVGVSHAEHEGLHAWRNQFDPDELERRYRVWARVLSRLHEPLGGPEAWKDVARRDSKGLRIDVDLEALGALECPVLLVRGDSDTAVAPDQYVELRGAIGRSEEFVVPAGGHDVQLTRSVVVTPVLLEFLERAGATPAEG